MSGTIDENNAELNDAIDAAEFGDLSKILALLAQTYRAGRQAQAEEDAKIHDAEITRLEAQIADNEAYVARLKEIKEAIQDGKPAISWKQAVAEWAEHELGQIAPSTAKRYGVSLTQCEPALSPYPVAKIDGKVINTLIASRRKNGATPATIRRDLTAISRVLEYAEAMEWREGNPTLTKRRLLKERRDPIELPTEEAIAAVLAVSSARFGAMIIAARLTGCRQDELVNVTWAQFNPKAQTLDVTGKGNKRRTLSLSETATRHIVGTPRTLGSGLIFCRESGEPFAQAASDFCHFRRIAAKANPDFARFRYHDLRHLYSVEALRSGMSIYTLQKHLGHSSVSTTEIYLEFLTAEQAIAAKRNSHALDGRGNAASR